MLITNSKIMITNTYNVQRNFSFINQEGVNFIEQMMQISEENNVEIAICMSKFFGFSINSLNITKIFELAESWTGTEFSERNFQDYILGLYYAAIQHCEVENNAISYDVRATDLTDTEFLTTQRDSNEILGASRSVGEED